MTEKKREALANEITEAAKSFPKEENWESDYGWLVRATKLSFSKTELAEKIASYFGDNVKFYSRKNHRALASSLVETLFVFSSETDNLLTSI